MTTVATMGALVMQSAATATGNGTSLPLRDKATGLVQVTGTFSATITWEATLNGDDWVAIQATPLATGTAATTATATGLYRITAAGLRAVRARISAYVSGKVTVVGETTRLS